MKTTIRAAAFVVGLVAASLSSAMAATVLGRITYYDALSKQLMLDNSDMYAVAIDPASPGLEVGRLVTVEVARHGSAKTITKVDEYT